MLRVLHVYRTFFPDPPGGLQEAIRQICRAITPYGIENTVFTLSPKPYPDVLDVEGITVVRSRSWCAPASCDIGGPDAFRRFHELADAADVVHFYFPWPFADALKLVSMRRQKPTVLTYISDIVRQRLAGVLYSGLMLKTLHSMDAIVANAPDYAKTSPVLSRSEFANRLHIIPLGIVEQGYWCDEDSSTLNRYSLQDDEFFLFVGVLRYYKGLHNLIEAAGSVHLPIVVAGDGPEGPALRKFASSRAAHNVIFTGQVSDGEKLALMRHCRALVLPSHLRSEAFGMVLVEAAMLGKPLISCAIGTGTSFVNLDQVTGIVTAPANSMALASALQRLESNRDLAHSFGAAARDRYLSLFSGTALGRSYAGLFGDVARRSCG